MKHTIWVKYKGGISRFINKDEEAFTHETELSLHSLIDKIFDRHQSLSDSGSPVSKQSMLVTINEKFIPQIEYEAATLKSGDVVTLFPTVSGG
ncbi:MAG: MoaD/ThiS family protein [Thermodesulfobacteriota bacterium]